MQLYFIRHAQSTNNSLYETTGSDLGRSDDPELTDTGILQAEYVARHLKDGNPNGGMPGKPTGFGLTHLYCSLMLRSVATGTIISRATGLRLQGMECIHECGGIYLDDIKTGERIGQAGKTREYFAEHFPDLELPESVDGRGWWANRAYEDESFRFPRAQQFLQDILAEHGNTHHRIAVVSHAGFYNEFLSAVMRLDQRPRGMWFVLNNTGITRIDVHGENFDLVYLNRTDHLPGNLLT